MRNTKSPAVFGSVNASPSPPLGALSCASAFTAGPAAAVPMPHSPMHSCSSWKFEESCATTRPAAHIPKLATTTALSPILSATIPDNGADTIPRSAVTLNSSPTCAGVASSACVANHGMHVSLATKPSALAAAAAVMTRCLSDSRRTRQSLAALIASSSRSISSSSSTLMSIDSAMRSSSRSAATLMSGSSEYPPVHANAADGKLVNYQIEVTFDASIFYATSCSSGVVNGFTCTLNDPLERAKLIATETASTVSGSRVRNWSRQYHPTLPKPSDPALVPYDSLFVWRPGYSHRND